MLWSYNSGSNQHHFITGMEQDQCIFHLGVIKPSPLVPSLEYLLGMGTEWKITVWSLVCEPDGPQTPKPRWFEQLFQWQWHHLEVIQVHHFQVKSSIANDAPALPGSNTGMSGRVMSLQGNIRCTKGGVNDTPKARNSNSNQGKLVHVEGRQSC